MSNNNNNSGGISLSGLTLIVFLVLKLTNVINWSWWWVTAPLWIPVVIVIVLAILAELILNNR